MSKKSTKTDGVLEFVKNPIFLFLVISFVIISGLAYFGFTLASGNRVVASSSDVKDDGEKQTVSVMAKNGFFPSVVNLKSNKPTTIKLSTENTIDCSNTLIISDINLRKDLPTTGETEIIIPQQKAGTKLTATCSMGHYFLELNFL